MRPLRWILVGALSVTACFDDRPRPSDASADAAKPDLVERDDGDDDAALTDAAGTDAARTDAAGTDAAGTDAALTDAPSGTDAPALTDAPAGWCARDDQCADHAAPLCDTSRGRCVMCLPSRDTCAPSQHCDPDAFVCVPGCRADEGCEADGGPRRCDTARHACVECASDSECGANTLCVLGTCVPGCSPARGCSSGQTCCDGTCHDILQDPAHCAACGRGCSFRNATPRCEVGSCVMGACNEPYANCDGAATNGCEVNTRADPAHCGACNNACAMRPNSTGASCVMGRCAFACAEGFADCDGAATNGCEVDLRANTGACGRCGNVCAAAPSAPSVTCTAGRCGYLCAADRGDCDGDAANGCEASTATSPAHCGGCGRACRSGPRSRPSCAAGRCGLQCDPGWGDCDGDPANGCETELNSAVANCGGCGRVCTIPGGTAACVMGRCAVASCGAVFTDCDRLSVNGCEADLRSDPRNCGACGRQCPTAMNAVAVCASSTCGVRCQDGFGDCDRDPANGCERDLRSDAASCGACGLVCALPRAAAACVNESCAVASCSAGYGDCDGVTGNGCETDLATSAAHCGACGRRGVELCDGVDNDCDGVADEGCPAGLTNLDTTTHTSPTFGSRVGTTYDLSCPAGTVARGMSGRVSSYLTQLSLLCATPRVVVDRASAPYRYTVALDAGPTVGPAGVSTGTAWSYTCPGDAVIGRIDGRTSGSVIYQISFDCFDLSVSGAPNSGFQVTRAAARESSPTFGPSSGSAFTYDCPASPGASLLRALFGTYYVFRIPYISSVAARCTRPVVSVR